MVGKESGEGLHKDTRPEPLAKASSLIVRGLSLWRDGRSEAILAGLDLAFASGQVAALCGPNGAGKSTLMAALARHRESGIHPSGEILWNGRPWDLSSPWDTHLLPQRQPFVPSDTVRTFSAFFASRPGFERSSFERLCEVFDVDRLLETPLGELSGGQWKRVQCACHFATRVPVRLLDEPESGLDGQAMARLSAEIRNCRTRNEIVVLASHSLSFIRATADRVSFLKQGRLTWDSSVQEFLVLGEAGALGF